jgi:hypothetical protein
MVQRRKGSPIQSHLEIKEIKDGVLILKNKGLRAVLMTTSLNFALKSTEEQDAIIYLYQNFLNSLDFSIQIIAASRKFNIDPYIQNIEQKHVRLENELLKIQAYEYVDFIKGLSEMTNIMTESFYLVVPYNPLILEKANFFDRLFNRKSKAEGEEQKFQELKNNLWQRVEFVVTSLLRIGLKSVPLKTDELIELFYKMYNPSAKEKPELSKAKEMRNQ